MGKVRARKKKVEREGSSGNKSSIDASVFSEIHIAARGDVGVGGDPRFQSWYTMQSL